MFDEGWAHDFGVFNFFFSLSSFLFFFFFKSFISPCRRHFNKLHINSTDVVGATDGPVRVCMWSRRVIVPSAGSTLNRLFFVEPRDDWRR